MYKSVTTMQNCTKPNYLHEVENQIPPSLNNKYVYFKQNFVPSTQQPIATSKVLVNPHFNKKVFVNPNYRPNNPTSGKIHVNPNVPSIHNALNKIHINPKILVNVPGPVENNHKLFKTYPEQKQGIVKQSLTYFSKTKLIRAPLKSPRVQESKRIRRTSIYSKFKIVKSSIINRTPDIRTQSKLLFNSKYKLKRTSTNKLMKSSPNTKKPNTRFKLDNRRKRVSSITKPTKFVFVNRFLSIKDIANKVPLRANKKVNLLNISGIIYKNSPNQLQRTSLVVKKDRRSSLVNLNRTFTKTRYKIIRASPGANKKKTKKNNLRYVSKRVNISKEKLRKCNIPCPYYRKFGKCKGKILGKCPRKHDPDQIALCTKFLQGACIDPKCLLSHNVSAEKMPTCKFYLEGSCSKDSCPYLHVRINPKADICRDFIEGFCRKASECDKRHQFLCPDFEKKGICSKSRCPYPHGRMVRKYSDFNKHKFAKKSSAKKETAPQKIVEEKIEPEEVNAAVRYYTDKKENNETEVDSNRIDFRRRPQLGELPCYISLEDT